MTDNEPQSTDFAAQGTEALRPATVSDVLSAAAEILRPEGAWVQGQCAKDAAGNEVMAHNPSAVCWCAVAALDLAAYRLSAPELYLEACKTVADDDFALILWNDEHGRTQSQVVALLTYGASCASTTDASLTPGNSTK